MERHREQIVSTLVLASALIAAIATFLLPPSLQAKVQTHFKDIYLVKLLKVLDCHPDRLNEVNTT